jgi:hypothetical protein
MDVVLVVRHTFWELSDDIPNVFEAGRNARSFSDFDIRYGEDHFLADLPEDGMENSTKFADACCKATAETCSSAGSSIDLSENWADMDTDTESDESEAVCATPAPEQRHVQQVMMPMGFVLVPMPQTNMVWGCQGVPQHVSVTSGNGGRSCVAPPPGHFSSNPQKQPERTTVVLRNLPAHLSRSEFVKILDDAGFGKRYDFVYLPTNFRNMTVFGYAIVNFSDPADALAALEQFRGADVDGQAMITEWSKSQQGYDDLVCRYRDSPVMHNSVPDKYKPIILANGQLQPFPSPTEPLHLPRKFTPTKDQRSGGGSILP